MPALSPTMTQGNLSRWCKSEGEEVAAGDVLAEVETDKATVDFETLEDGYLAKILVKEGTNDIQVGTPVAIFVEDKGDISAFADYSPDQSTARSDTKPKEKNHSNVAEESVSFPEPKKQATHKTTSSDGRVAATPKAKAFAKEQGIDLASPGIEPTGFQDRITYDDVVKFSESDPSTRATAPSTASSASPRDGYKDLDLSNMRKIIADRLLESKQTIPHYYLTVEVNADRMLSLRQKLNARLEKEKTEKPSKVSVNDFVIKASAAALHRVPEVNSSWMKDFIRQYDYVDISVAVSTPNGLITPIVKDADKKGLRSVSETVKDLATRARDSRLKPDEFQGGTFTISNLGMFGISNFSAIINPPQAAILAVGASQSKVVGVTADGAPITSNVFNVTLSCDHRVIDGAVGAMWLKEFKSYIEDPETLLL